MSVTYFVDIANGSDGNVGSDIDSAFKTVLKAVNACVAGNNDIIYLVSTGTDTVIDEVVNINKAGVTLFGENQRIKLLPTTTGSPTLTISSSGVCVKQLGVDVTSGGTDNAITINGVDDVQLKRLRVENATDNGIELVGVDDVLVEGCHIDSSTNDGIKASGTCTEIILKENTLHANGGYGINISDVNCVGTQLGYNKYVSNTSGNYQDLGTDTYREGDYIQEIHDLHGQINRGVYINTEEATNGQGYQQDPFNNFTDAVDYAEDNGLLELDILADATVDRQLKNFIIRGIGRPTIDLNDQIMDKSTFERVTLTGAYTGDIQATECAVVNLSGARGVFLTCSFAGTITPASGNDLLISRIAPAIAANPWTLDMNTGAASTVAIHNLSGGVIVDNMDDAGDTLHILSSQGEVIINASCTAGTIVIGGSSKITDNSTGTTVVDNTTNTLLTNIETDASLIRKVIAGRRAVISPDDLTITIYEDDNTTVAATFSVSADGRLRERTA